MDWTNVSFACKSGDQKKCNLSKEVTENLHQISKQLWTHFTQKPQKVLKQKRRRRAAKVIRIRLTADWCLHDSKSLLLSWNQSNLNQKGGITSPPTEVFHPTENIPLFLIVTSTVQRVNESHDGAPSSISWFREFTLIFNLTEKQHWRWFIITR